MCSTEPGVVRQLAAGVDALLAEPAWRCTGADLLETLADLETATRRLAAARLRLVAEVDRRGAATDAGASSTTAWLAGTAKIRPGSAARDVWLARALHERFPRTAQALEAGEVGVETAHLVARTVAGLPEGRGVEVLDQAEEFLLDQARLLDPAALSKVARHLRHVVDPDGADRLAAEEHAAACARQLTVSADGAGFLLRGWLDAEGGAALLSALSPLAAPRPAADLPDTRSPARRRADALVELAMGALDSGSLPTEGGQRPHLTVTMTLETLLGAAGAPAADLGFGPPLSAASARRIACDAGVVPVVLGSASQPLDVGRSTSVVPQAIRRALVARDRGCAFPGCDRPPGWCDAHHVWHWADGGPTSLDNLVLLCGFHHRLVHHSGWSVEIGADGLPVFEPPPWQAARLVGGPVRAWRSGLDGLAVVAARGP